MDVAHLISMPNKTWEAQYICLDLRSLLSNESYINMISRLDANIRATEPVFKQLVITHKSMHVIDN